MTGKWLLLAVAMFATASCGGIGDGASIRGFCQKQSHLNCACFVKEIEKKKADNPDGYKIMIRYLDMKAHGRDQAADDMLSKQPMKDSLYVAGAAVSGALACATAG
jgi:hypothetical protein